MRPDRLKVKRDPDSGEIESYVRQMSEAWFKKQFLYVKEHPNARFLGRDLGAWETFLFESAQEMINDADPDQLESWGLGALYRSE